MSDVAIKPIDWTYDQLRKVWHGNVHIPDTPGYIVRRASWSLKGQEGARFLYEDDERAKIAAQEDYEERIRCAFISPKSIARRREWVHEAIAEAILGERERCARIAESRSPLWEEATAIAAAIRQQATP